MHVVMSRANRGAVLCSDRHAFVQGPGIAIVTSIQLTIEQVPNCVRVHVHSAAVQVGERVFERCSIHRSPQIDKTESTSHGLLFRDSEPPHQHLAKLGLIVRPIVRVRKSEHVAICHNANFLDRGFATSLHVHAYRCQRQRGPHACAQKCKKSMPPGD